MARGRLGRVATGVCAVALAGLVTACAENPPPREVTYPPPAVAPSAYGSSGPWLNPRAAGLAYSVAAPLHLREAPGVEAPVLGTLPPGMRVRTTGSIRGSWWEVQTPDGTGWVIGRYLAPT